MRSANRRCLKIKHRLLFARNGYNTHITPRLGSIDNGTDWIMYIS